jgi:drug/metabolite transporter (DMT)-like permease
MTGRPPPSDFNRGLTATTIGMILFGTGPVIVAGSDVDGLAAAFWRAVLACGAMLIVALARNSIPARTVRLTVVPGLAFGVGIGLFFSAAQLTSVANTALITVLQPLPIMVGAHFIFAERIQKPDIGWSAVAIGGAVFMVLSAGSAGTSHLGGDLLSALSAVSGSIYFLSSKHSRLELDTIPFMVGMFAWAAVVLGPLALIAGQSFGGYPEIEWLRLAALAALPGLGHVLINYSHGKIPLAVMGVLHLLIPVVATLLAFWFLDQTISVAQLAGMLVVMTAMSAHSVYRSRVAAATPAA